MSSKEQFQPSSESSLGVCSESSLCAQLVDKEPSFLHADSEDFDQTDLSSLDAQSFC